MAIVSDGRRTHGPVQIAGIGSLPRYLAAYVKSGHFYPKFVTLIGDSGWVRHLEISLEGKFIQLREVKKNPRRRRSR